jgi:glyoxylase-like metal-dependent hydrolase (beta-lactamase superfamily II)
MACFICVTCGVQYPERATPPEGCPICEDERQYVGWNGQRWTTLEEMRAQGYRNLVREEEPGLWSLQTQPAFAIGQRAFLVQTPEGNLLWDCITLIDEESIATVRRLGGVRAIAVSHPHYYSAIVEWSDTFGGAPIYIHADDEQWVVRRSPALQLFTAEQLPLFGGITLVRLGGHFPGGIVAHWPAGADGQGVLLSGDIIQVVMDRRWVSFMYSYPNLVPLSAAEVSRIVERVRPFRFERIWGAFAGRQVMSEGRAAVERSARRYLERLQAP